MFDVGRPGVSFVLKEVAAIIAVEAQKAAASPHCPSTRETTRSDCGWAHQPSHLEQQQQSELRSSGKTAWGARYIRPHQRPEQHQALDKQTVQQESQCSSHTYAPTNNCPDRAQASLPLLLPLPPQLPHQISVRLGNCVEKPSSLVLPASTPPLAAATEVGATSAGLTQHRQQSHRQHSPKRPSFDAKEVSNVFASLNEASKCLRNIKRHRMSTYLKCSIAGPSPNAAFRFHKPPVEPQQQEQAAPQRQERKQQHVPQQEENLRRMYVRQRLALLRDTFGEQALYEACAVYIQAAFRGWRVRRRYQCRLLRGSFNSGVCPSGMQSEGFGPQRWKK